MCTADMINLEQSISSDYTNIIISLDTTISMQFVGIKSLPFPFH